MERDFTTDRQTARGRRKRDRARKRSLRRRATANRRRTVGKVLACALLLALFAGLGFAVGSSDYAVVLVGWVPFLMTLAGIVLGGVYVHVLRTRIEIGDELSAGECQRDAQVPFNARFKNRTPLLVARAEASFYIADMFDNIASESSTTMVLSPFEEAQIGFNTRFEHIGTYHAGLKSVRISDFVGLFSATIENDAKSEVQVTPKIIDLDGIRFSNESMDEQTKAAKSVLADSMEYAYSREYEQGDPLKTIHWKLSARTGTYMTRLYEVYTNPSVLILMDFYAASQEAVELMSIFDAVVESAFSLARYAQRQGMDVALSFNDKYGEEQLITSFGDDVLARTVSQLPRMSNDPADAADAIERMRRHTASVHGFNNIFMCSGDVGAEMVSAVIEAKLRRRSPSMVAVIPSRLVGRERQEWCRNLLRFEDEGIAYSIITKSEELSAAGGE